MFCVVSFASTDLPGYERSWQTLKEDGTFARSEWVHFEGGEWSYIGDDSYALVSTWFQDVDGNWYYFDPWGVMLADATTPDGYYVGANGAWVQD